MKCQAAGFAPTGLAFQKTENSLLVRQILKLDKSQPRRGGTPATGVTTNKQGGGFVR